MANGTSLTTQMARGAAEDEAAAKKADALAAAQDVEPGWVWVRLIRPCYDSEGQHHPIGIAKLRKGTVPSTAIVLSHKDAAEAASDEKVDAKKIARAQTSVPGESVNDDFK